jgi:tetratricopeptide (TPR) repeat protein
VDSNTLQLVGAGGLILVLTIAAFISYRRDQAVVMGARNPRPKVELKGISPADQQERAAFVLRQVRDLERLPWGERAMADRLEAERLYQGTLDRIADAEGDYRKLGPTIEDLLRLPKDLALSGVARIVLTLAYFRAYMYSPEGIQAALAFTSAAVKADPLSADAWIMRLDVASSVADPTYARIAKAALKQAQKLDPNHLRLPAAESNFYRRYGSNEQYEAALRRMIDLAPSPIVKRKGYDGLAWFYATHGRLDDALATYQEYFRQDPQGSAWTWHNYSLWLMRAKRYREALDASDRALGFFEFQVARDTNNKARAALGMSPRTPAAE